MNSFQRREKVIQNPKRKKSLERILWKIMAPSLNFKEKHLIILANLTQTPFHTLLNGTNYSQYQLKTTIK